ncbi:hypothetical protein CGCVW01_v007759 [Colletotrichum viniferum]|nr:hypothetical protein CGCVW01_v007759 [Colletotrichum viniferum]
MNGYREPAEKIVAHELDHGPEVVPGQYWPTPAHHGIDARQYSQQVPPGSGSDVRRICGLHRSTFYLALVLAVVIIVGSVGGGVGGSLAVKNAQRGAQSAQQSQASYSDPKRDQDSDKLSNGLSVRLSKSVSDRLTHDHHPDIDVHVRTAGARLSQYFRDHRFHHGRRL